MNETEAQRRGREATYKQCGILANWHDKTLADFTGDKKVYEFIESYMQAGKNKKGVFLTGPNGTGKSLLMNTTFRYFVDNKRLCRVISFPDLISEYAKNFRGEGILKSLMRVEYLGIDDVGKNFDITLTSKELAIAALDYVLRYRVQDNKPTWITTNLKENEVATRYTPDIASLLNEACTLCRVDGEDQRKQQFESVKGTKGNDTGESTIFNHSGK